MHLIIKRLFLAGLMTLPVACAPYARQYYNSGYGYSPGTYSSGYAYPSGRYDSGYGVVEQNQYNTYSYPSYSYPQPTYRTDVYRHDHYNDRDRHKHHQNNRQQFNMPAQVYSPRPHADRDDGNRHYNRNNPGANAYGQGGGEHHRHVNEWTGHPQGNWGRQAERQQTRQYADQPVNSGGSNWQNSAPARGDRHHGGHPGQGRGRHQNRDD